MGFDHRDRATMCPMRQRLLLALAIVLPPLGALLYFVWLAGDAWAQPVYGAIKIAMIAIALVGWRLLGRGAWKRAFAIHRQSIGLGILYGAVIAGILISLFLILSPLLSPFSSSVQSGALTLIPAAFYIPIAIVFSLIHSLLEEWYWRGYVGGSLLSLMAPSRATVLAALAFTLHHIVILWQLFPGPWAVLMSFGVFAAGVFWMWLYKKTGSLIAPWISHAFADLAIFGIGYMLIAIHG